MKKLFKGIGLALFAAFVISNAAFAAGERGSADEAVAMVKKAVAYMKEHGKEKSFAAFADTNNKDFHDRDLYLFVYDFNGVAVAHGNNPKMVGKNLIDMKDNDGKAIIRGFIDIANAKGKGWFDYKWPNPVTKVVEQKSGYVEKVDDLIIGSGIYK